MQHNARIPIRGNVRERRGRRPFLKSRVPIAGGWRARVSAARSGTSGGRSGARRRGTHYFLIQEAREKRGESDQPTNENESDGESRGIVTKRKARGVTSLCLGSRIAGARISDPREFSSRTHWRELVYFNRDDAPNIFLPKNREKIICRNFQFKSLNIFVILSLSSLKFIISLWNSVFL